MAKKKTAKKTTRSASDEIRSVTVEVKGKAGTGKSTIAKVIEDALLDKGFMVRFVDDDDTYPHARLRNHDQKVEGLRERVAITVMTVALSRKAVMAI